jgi:hypothetical protein
MDFQAEALAWNEERSRARPRTTDLDRLLWMGERLEESAAEFGGETLAMWLAKVLLRVRNRDGKIVGLEANRAQREFERRRGQQNIVLKARQMGISTWVAGRFFLRTITRPGTLTMQVAHSREGAEQIFRIVHRFYDQLPEGLRDGVLRVSRANVGQLVFPELDSEYRVESAADVNAGRGMTVQNLHCSEVARWNGDAAETLASLRAALAPGGELVMESTPNGAYGCFYDEWERAAETGLVPHFFPWWMEPAYAGVPVSPEEWADDEREMVEAHGLTSEQIGYRRALRSAFGRVAAQEFAESPEGCFLASGNCLFDLEQIARRTKTVHDPVETRLNGQLWLWYPPVPGRQYLLGVDPAGGGADGDYSAVQVVDEASGLQCAELRAHLSPRELAKTVVALGREYNSGLLVVERNNHGHGVLAHLDTARYPAVYEHGGQPGWPTNSMTRPRMLEIVSAALEAQPEIFSSSRLLGECRTFVRQADGRTGAAAGVHDDCVMAMAVALVVRGERSSSHSRQRMS